MHGRCFGLLLGQGPSACYWIGFALRSEISQARFMAVLFVCFSRVCVRVDLSALCCNGVAKTSLILISAVSFFVVFSPRKVRFVLEADVSLGVLSIVFSLDLVIFSCLLIFPQDHVCGGYPKCLARRGSSFFLFARGGVFLFGCLVPVQHLGLRCFLFSFLVSASGQVTGMYQIGGRCSGDGYPEGRCDVVAVYLSFLIATWLLCCGGSIRVVLSSICLAGCLFRGAACLEHCLTPKGEAATCT